MPVVVCTAQTEFKILLAPVEGSTARQRRLADGFWRGNVRAKGNGRGNVATAPAVGGKLSAFRKTAEIPLKTRSARIRKDSPAAGFSLCLRRPLFPSNPCLARVLVLHGVTPGSRAQPLNSKLLSGRSRAARGLGSSRV
ncbi:hypothetical protein KM043_006899 [Ampulex compressa]|nr:hypothetical protein KM043_006899 [Ampulex compressa]